MFSNSQSVPTSPKFINLFPLQQNLSHSPSTHASKKLRIASPSYDGFLLYEQKALSANCHHKINLKTTRKRLGKGDYPNEYNVKDLTSQIHPSRMVICVEAISIGNDIYQLN